MQESGFDLAFRSLQQLQGEIAGELLLERSDRQIYANDASIYQQIPTAVMLPKTVDDIHVAISYARATGLGLIPRTAGTSLAGQVVGDGIVVDVSKYLNNILEINRHEGWVRVQPGVIRDELNQELARHRLYFGPETSTANRAMIGGMLGNNSSGANSIVYGSMRDHVLEVRGYLSDGTMTAFGPLSTKQFQQECRQTQTRRASIFQCLNEILGSESNREEIRRRFPLPSIHRRNSGYAIDRMIDNQPFGHGGPCNLAQLIAGSEGTLLFATEIKLQCVPLPPNESVLVCAHFQTVNEALQATQMAMRFQPHRCELIDHYVVNGAARNLGHRHNLDFVSGTPKAILMIEFCGTTIAEVRDRADQMAGEFRRVGLGYAFPVLEDERAERAWHLRRAGLGVLHNQVSAAKPIALIEDTAVALDDLPAFIGEVDRMLLDEFGMSTVHYGHAGAGEIHLRPLLDLNVARDRERLRPLGLAMAQLVKKYRGSLSGEHGDGRLRGEFLSTMLGEECYGWLKKIKRSWDPDHVFNPGKIIDAPLLNQSLRPSPVVDEQPTSVFRFSESGSLLAAVTQCSGSGDCRKSSLAGGTMCPSYQATRNERDTTRARANLLRQRLTLGGARNERFGDPDVKSVLDLCLSCKACKRECLSSVDMAKVKAEFLQGYFDVHGVPFATRCFSSVEALARLASRTTTLANVLSQHRWSAGWLKRILGIHPRRKLPRLAMPTLRQWEKRRRKTMHATTNASVFLFCDEFTNYFDTGVGIAAIEVLEHLGYNVVLADHVESGRSAISCGLLRRGKTLAEQNVRLLSRQLGPDDVLIGIEPSTLLTLRDEYPDLVDIRLVADAKSLAERTLLIDEFLGREIDARRITSERFGDRAQQIVLHAHCHQKALSEVGETEKVLALPKNFKVTSLSTGCCGMAGVFGYQKEHFELSMRIGELMLFPQIRGLGGDIQIAATGFSCRQQIFDGTERQARHPMEILRDALA